MSSRAADTRSSLPSGPAGLPEQGGCLWWRDGSGFVGHGRALTVPVGTGPTRGAAAWASVRDDLSAGRRDGLSQVAMCSFTFDPDADGSVMFVPETVTHHDDDSPGTGPAPVLDRLRYARGEMDELRWLDEVAAAVDAIEAGGLSKVVLARDEIVWAKSAFSEREIAMRLARRFPQCYTFVCDGLVGATPELLVRKRGNEVQSLVLAGSARRGTDPSDDDAYAAALLASDKERSEHDLAVASVADVLADVCAEVTVASEPEILRLANVQHLATKVTATLASTEMSVLDLVDLLHPTAAVGGVPRAAALERIRSAEGGLRGRYAGPVGWIDADGDGEFGIALRCALVSGGRAQLFAGAGIVAGSLPEAELEETRLKLRAMESVLGPTL